MLYHRDSLPHVNLSYLSTELNKEVVRNITHLMKQTFPGVKIYATFGNHDYYKKDQFPPHGNEIYNATYLIWKEWINDPTQESNFRKGTDQLLSLCSFFHNDDWVTCNFRGFVQPMY